MTRRWFPMGRFFTGDARRTQKIIAVNGIRRSKKGRTRRWRLVRCRGADRTADVGLRHCVAGWKKCRDALRTQDCARSRAKAQISTIVTATPAIKGEHRGMGTLFLTLAWSAMLVQPQSARPACNAKTAGHLWPAAAVSDAGAQWRLAQDGDLEMCMCHNRRYHWRPVTVNVHRLAAARK